MVQTFGLDPDLSPWMASIAGRKHVIHTAPSGSHFANINILGGDFCYIHQLRPWMDDDGRMVTYYIGKKKWDVTPRL